MTSSHPQARVVHTVVHSLVTSLHAPLPTRPEIKDFLREDGLCGLCGFCFSTFFFFLVCLLVFCQEVCSTCKYVLSDRTLYVLLMSRSCPYCMRCSEWKTEIKKALYFVSESQGLSFVHILDGNCIYSQQRPSGGSSLMLSALPHVVQGVLHWKCCAAGVFDFFLTFFWSPFPLLSSTFLSTLSQRVWRQVFGLHFASPQVTLCISGQPACVLPNAEVHCVKFGLIHGFYIGGKFKTLPISTILELDTAVQ